MTVVTVTLSQENRPQPATADLTEELPCSGWVLSICGLPSKYKLGFESEFSKFRESEGSLELTWYEEPSLKAQNAKKNRFVNPVHVAAQYLNHLDNMGFRVNTAITGDGIGKEAVSVTKIFIWTCVEK